jgi:hypothetical protein
VRTQDKLDAVFATDIEVAQISLKKRISIKKSKN